MGSPKWSSKLTEVGGHQQRLSSIAISQSTNEQAAKCWNDAFNDFNGEENLCCIWLHFILNSLGLICGILGAQELADFIRITKSCGAALINDLRFQYSSWNIKVNIIYELEFLILHSCTTYMRNCMRRAVSISWVPEESFSLKRIDFQLFRQSLKFVHYLKLESVSRFQSSSLYFH